ncbi:MAG: hypothetical protein J0I06_06520 [Planctomycetes bacterium]|nr:hypothetical protein [Planctomycetota bacterium]
MPSDEKRAFVGKKPTNCSPYDDRRGDRWNRVAIDPGSRAVGKRTAEAAKSNPLFSG